MSKMRIGDFESRLRIDRSALDDELVEQPELLYHAAVQFSLAVSRRDAAKDSIKQLDAEIALRLRKTSEEKITAAGMKEMIDSDEQHIEAVEEHRQFIRESDQWGAMKDAIVSRGYVLRDLVSLDNRLHFQTGEISVEASHARREMSMMRKQEGGFRTKKKRRPRL